MWHFWVKIMTFIFIVFDYFNKRKRKSRLKAFSSSYRKEYRELLAEILDSPKLDITNSKIYILVSCDATQKNLAKVEKYIVGRNFYKLAQLEYHRTVEYDVFGEGYKVDDIYDVLVIQNEKSYLVVVLVLYNPFRLELKFIHASEKVNLRWFSVKKEI